MAVYFIRGFTAVPGDAAYIEAASVKEAADCLVARLELGGMTEHCAPREQWDITEMHSPICLLVWRD